MKKVFWNGLMLASAITLVMCGGVVNHLAVGAGGGINIEPGTYEVVFKTFGKSSEGDGENMYTGGKMYSMKLK